MLREKNTRQIIWVGSLSLFIYVALRAYFVSFTSDESFTYLNYVRGGWDNVYLFTYTNNHLLNSWLMKCCNVIYGSNEFSLRLPNLLSFALFLYYGAQLLFKLKDRRIALAGFIFLNVNPFVLDFFSLARGYGISMGLMLMALYYLYALFYIQRSTKNILLCIIPACLAVLANLTMINFLIAIILLMIGAALFPGLSPRVNGIIWKSNRWKIVIVPTLLVSAFLFFLLPKIFQLKLSGNFDFGGNTGIWYDTVNSLIGNSFYGIHFWHSPSFDLRELMILFLYLIYYLIEFMIIAVLINYAFKKLYYLFTDRSIRPEGFIWFLFMILLFCVGAIGLQHRIFHIPFSVDRAAIYLIPLFSLFFIFWMDTVRSNFNKLSWIGISTVISLTIFIPSINLSYCHWWRSEAGINKLMDKLSMNFDIDVERSALVGVDAKYRSVFNYYRSQRDELWKIFPSNNDEIIEKGKFEYYLIPCRGSSDYGGKVLDSNRISEIVLIHARRPDLRTIHYAKIDYEDSISQKRHGVIPFALPYEGKYGERTNPNNNYATSFIDTILDPISYNDHLINFEAAFKRTDAEAEGIMVISVERKGKIVVWKKMDIREFVTQENTWMIASFATYLPNDLQSGDVLRSYFWNQSKFDIYIDHQVQVISFLYR